MHMYMQYYIHAMCVYIYIYRYKQAGTSSTNK